MNVTDEARAQAGAAFLDTADPGWWRADDPRAINLERLDLGDPAGCILGQRCPAEILARHCGVSPSDKRTLEEQPWRAYPAYASALAGISINEDHRGLRDWGCKHGFNAPAGTYEDLTAAWRRIITQRRAAAR